MKIIGLLGGMSWESTAEYYKIINSNIKHRLGGLHSAKILMYSLDFAEIEKLQHEGDWNAAAKVLTESARRIEAGGAECLLLCTNTMHKLAEEIIASVKIPFLHIADATADQIKRAGIKKIGLLGTRFTMEEEFYRGRLIAQHGLEVIIPPDNDRDIIHRVIYDELCKGIILGNSKHEFRRIISDLESEGAEGIILGCTEIGLLVQSRDCRSPVFDTTQIHAESAVEFALGTT